ncbi:MAG: hypothetical protein ACFB0B_12245 [Thermonemataceae bacterium]
MADARISSFYEKKMAVTYNFSNHFHPYVGFLLEKLSKESLEGLLANTTQEVREKRATFFDNIYQPHNDSKDETITVNVEDKQIDVSEAGAYSVYNWELFFHVPFSIAVHLSKNQRFAEAQKWFHYVFDPTSNEKITSASPQALQDNPHLKFWKFKAFREKSSVDLIDDVLKALSKDDDEALKESVEKSIEGWREKPFQPHVIARTRFGAYQFSVVMKYCDNLIAWGDSLFRQDTIEMINEATQLYVLAANILGEKPQEIPRRGTTRPQTFATLRNKLDAFSNAMVELEGQFPFNLSLPKTEKIDTDGSGTLFNTMPSLYFCIPENTKLLSYWDTVADRLFKIRNCMNIEGIVRQLPLFQPPIDPGMLVKAAAAGIDISSLVSGLNQPLSPIRSTLLLQKALEICGEVRSLGNNLLSALEKKDGEALSLLRQQQEIKMMELNAETRFLQWKEAESSTDALLKSRETAYQRYQHYQLLLGKSAEEYADLATLEVERKALMEGSTAEERTASFDGMYQELITKYASDIELEAYPAKEHKDGGKLHLNKNEDKELNDKLPEAKNYQNTAQVTDLITSALFYIPTFTANFSFWGIGGKIQIGGEHFGNAGNATSSGFKIASENASHKANTASRTSSYERRAEDWTLQSNLAAKELVQIGKQIISSLIREQITKKEYENQLQQLTHAQEIDTFLKDKFTNEELYKWMHGELSKVYYDCYKFAFDIAKKAETTMKWELMRPEVDERSFIKFNYWDAGRKGLLSGESLYLDLKRMEMAYHDYNKREYELTKHVSLRQLNPYALLQLKATGKCNVEIPEWLFDLDCPGHFMRRIKSVALSIPAVAGPYTSINCTLSLQKSTIRKSALLSDDEYARQEEENRFIDYFGTIQSIVTSNAQNDSGLFEVNMQDQRFLPFENAGVISTWQLELPSDLRQFDYNTITDVILHIRYTARQGGGLLGGNTTQYIREELIPDANKAGLARLFSLKHDFPSEWHRFTTSEEESNFKATLSRDHFPYLAQVGDILLSGSGDEPIPFELWIFEDNQLKPLPLTKGDITEAETIGESDSQIAHTFPDLNEESRTGQIEIVRELLQDHNEVFLIVNYKIEVD